MKHKMVELSEAQDPILTALHNCEAFDHVRFDAWCSVQGGGIQRTVRLCPPDRLYELASAPRTGSVYFILGYRKDGGVAVQSVLDTERVIHCHPDELRDVTRDLRRERGLDVA